MMDENEIEALARVIASEAGDGGRDEQLHIGWAARNRRSAEGKSLYELEFPWRAQSGRNPPFSSARPATAASRVLAQDILAAPQEADPTGRADTFWEPGLQDLLKHYGDLWRSGQKTLVNPKGKVVDLSRFAGYKKTADEVRASWTARGERLLYKLGRFEFWKTRA